MHLLVSTIEHRVLDPQVVMIVLVDAALVEGCIFVVPLQKYGKKLKTQNFRLRKCVKGPSVKVSFSFLKVIFSALKVTLSRLKVIFSRLKVTFSGKGPL